ARGRGSEWSAGERGDGTASRAGASRRVRVPVSFRARPKWATPPWGGAGRPIATMYVQTRPGGKRSEPADEMGPAATRQSLRQALRIGDQGPLSTLLEELDHRLDLGT